jgi:hypothetical protein
MEEIGLSECAVWYQLDLVTGEKEYHGPLCRDKNHGNCAEFALAVDEATERKDGAR